MSGDEHGADAAGAGEGVASIQVLAVTADDVVTAAEARFQRDEPVVLRVTPPYSGRMRARLHVATGADPGTVHVDPRDLLSADAPAYPRPADTEDELRADPDVEYTVECHHERHRAALADWRERVRESFVDETVIATPEGEQTVDVVVLG
jgi:hypothetical protein